MITKEEINKKFREKLSKEENDEYDNLLIKYNQSCYEQKKSEHILFDFEYSRKHQEHKDVSKSDAKTIRDMNFAVSAQYLNEIESIKNRKESESA